jgi:hypothetical protein
VFCDLTSADDYTLLHVLAGFGKLETTTIYIGKCAAIFSTNKYVDTPLMLVAYSGQFRSVLLPHKNGKWY